MQPSAAVVLPALAGTRLVAPIVEAVVLLTLIIVFALLLPLASQRRVVATWIVAWVISLLKVIGTGIVVVLVLLGMSISVPLGLQIWVVQLEPALELVALTAIVLGSLGAVGWRVPTTAQRWSFILAFAAGIGLGMTSANVQTAAIAFADIAVVFGAIEWILFRGPMQPNRGTLLLVTALAIYVTASLVSTGGLVFASHTAAPDWVQRIGFNSKYFEALGVGVLGASALVLIVQESVAAVQRAQDDRIAATSQSETRLFGIIQAAQEAIVTLDADGRIELLNRSAEELLGVKREECAGALLADFMTDPDEFSDHLAVASSPDAGPMGGPMAAQVQRASGQDAMIEYTVGTLDHDQRRALVVVMRDVTARLAEAAERAEFERKMAETDKIVAVGRVVSGVAHELNNPLAVVLGQSEQLVDMAPPGELRDGLAMILGQAERARHIVRDLLTFVRRREYPSEEANLGTLILRMVDAQRVIAQQRGITLRTAVATDLPRMPIDRASVEEVLVNLVDNAIDAANRGGWVLVTACTVGEIAEISVEDSGAGIPADILPRLFEPFVTTKPPGEGTGLGLSVCRAITKQMGGELLVENRPAPGVGVRFTLRVPPAPSAKSPKSPQVRTERRRFPRPPRPGAMAFLIDDETSVRATLARLFGRATWMTRQAASGEEALAWLREIRDEDFPAVILCDLKMPGMSGDDLYRTCLAERRGLAERFIFVTGDVIGSASDPSIVDSGRDVVEKPFTIVEIARAVERVLQQNL